MTFTEYYSYLLCRIKRLQQEINSISAILVNISYDAGSDTNTIDGNVDITGLLTLGNENVNTLRVSTYADLEAIVDENNYIGLVLVNIDESNDDMPTLYLVYNNTHQWIPSQEIV